MTNAVSLKKMYKFFSKKEMDNIVLNHWPTTIMRKMQGKAILSICWWAEKEGSTY